MRVRPPRTEYRIARLSESGAPAEPFTLFGRWFEAVLERGGADPHAMVLATADARGRPSARAMLLKEWSAEGFVFASNYESRKGREIAANPRAALLFYWPVWQRQVRVEGRIAPLTAAENDSIWAERPREAQIGAWTSRQSRAVASRAALERRLADMVARFDGGPVPRPPHWGGFRLRPQVIEFWQGRVGRLHDRLVYTRRRSGWTRVRLSP
jgi:pyridoxamine 5'-phosphate oxidase